LYLLILVLILGPSSSESYSIVINDISYYNYCKIANSVANEVLMFYL